jgi:AcrR family transcriptional regulator
MPRPAKAPREDMIEKVLDAAERAARAGGLRAIGMRRIASEIGYVAGSIYNTLGDLDEVILRLNARTLRRLREHIADRISPRRDAASNAFAVADAYLDFVAADPLVWSLILEHSTPGREFPDWYQHELSQTTGLVDEVLKPLIPDPAERRASVAILWAALHGLASLSSTGKLAVINGANPRGMAHLLIARFLGISGVDQPPKTRRKT